MTEIIVTPAEALGMGWSIIPVRKDKLPMVAWKTYQSRQATETEFQAWLARNPPAWAIVTGEYSHRVILDFDGDKGKRTHESFHLPAHRRTPSDGLHSDMGHPGAGRRVPTLSGKVKEELNKLWPGLDIRGDGGYAIFTGETNRGKYTWLRDPDPYPWEVLPQDLREFLESAGNPAAAPSPEEGAAREVDPEELIRRALKLIGAQGRNASGFWLATQLRDNQYSYQAALDAMQAYRSRCPAVNTKGQPEAYAESEMRATLEQAYSRLTREPWERPNGYAPAPSTENEDTHFALTEEGVFHTHQEKDKAGNFRPVTVKVCSPLEVLAYARDPNSEAWGRLLQWPDADQKVHSWVVPMSMLVGDNSPFRETLADGGLEIGTAPKSLLAQYVMSRRPERRLLCAPQVGWLDQCFIAPEWVIPENGNVAYQSMGRGEHFYRTSGTREEWTEHVGKKCIGNPLLVFFMSCALAGPLMRELNVQGGGFALEGESSTGKTTALIVAGSVWGGGGRLGFCRTFAATHAALESIAELHNDTCLLLDELALARPDELQETIYMLSNGFGRSRNNREMTGRRTLSWLMMILANGEIPPADQATKAGQKMRGGAEARLAAIPADSGRWGVFENLHDTDDPRVFAETLEDAARRYYGTAARAFLEYIVTHWEETFRECHDFIERFIEKNLPTDAAPEIRRILRRCALAGAAGEKATEIGITGWPPLEAQRAAMIVFKRLIERRGTVAAADRKNAIEQVRAFIASDHSRFYAADPKTIETKDGETIPLVEKIPNAAGYWKEMTIKGTTESELVYLIHMDVFRNQVCRGFTASKVARYLEAAKLLITNENDRYSYKSQADDITHPSKVGNSGRPRFYAVRAAILEYEP